VGKTLFVKSMQKSKEKYDWSLLKSHPIEVIFTLWLMGFVLYIVLQELWLSDSIVLFSMLVTGLVLSLGTLVNDIYHQRVTLLSKVFAVVFLVCFSIVGIGSLLSTF